MARQYFFNQVNPKSAKEKTVMFDECDIVTTTAFVVKRQRLVRMTGVQNSGIELYACEFCPYTSLVKGNVKMHTKSHTGQKDKVCSDCPFKTTNPSTLQRHRVRHHHATPRKRRPLDVVTSQSASTSNDRVLVGVTTNQSPDPLIDLALSIPSSVVELQKIPSDVDNGIPNSDSTEYAHQIVTVERTRPRQLVAGEAHGPLQQTRSILPSVRTLFPRIDFDLARQRSGYHEQCRKIIPFASASEPELVH